MDRAELLCELEKLEGRPRSPESTDSGTARIAGIPGLLLLIPLGILVYGLAIREFTPNMIAYLVGFGGLAAVLGGQYFAARRLHSLIRESVRAHVRPLLEGGLLESALAGPQRRPQDFWLELPALRRWQRPPTLAWFVSNYYGIAAARKLHPYPVLAHAAGHRRGHERRSHDAGAESPAPAHIRQPVAAADVPAHIRRRPGLRADPRRRTGGGAGCAHRGGVAGSRQPVAGCQ